MKFSYQERTLDTQALLMSFYEAPWDREIVGVPVATISTITIRKLDGASRDFGIFESWRDQNRIDLVSCRIPHAEIRTGNFLERRGFRFIELNYLPKLSNVQHLPPAELEVSVEVAEEADRMKLEAMAGQIFDAGRFHNDPELGAEMGNRRYCIWMSNAFDSANQIVFKCMNERQIVAFFVVERPQEHSCFWSLVGLAPGLRGRGFGRRVWRSMIEFHRRNGVQEIATSISSHNSAVFNLYVSLGFRFPEPSITLHWTRSG